MLHTLEGGLLEIYLLSLLYLDNSSVEMIYLIFATSPLQPIL